MTTNAKTSTDQAVDLGRVWWVGLAAVALATLVNGLVRLAALALMEVDPGFTPLQSPAFLPFTIIGGGAGVLVFALLARRARRPFTTFQIVAAVALVVSLLPDLGLLGRMPGANAATVGTLMLMHGLTAAIIVGMLSALTRKR